MCPQRGRRSKVRLNIVVDKIISEWEDPIAYNGKEFCERPSEIVSAGKFGKLKKYFSDLPSSV